MKFRFFSPVYLESNADVVLPSAADADYTTRVFVAGDDPIVAQALYDHITSNIDVNRSVSNDDFNEALDAALNTEGHRVKKCNLAVAIYNSAGCFVAQMGRSRVLQYRPSEQEFLYDSMKQVLDIYSSKAKVEQIRDFAAGDFLLLCTAEGFEPRNLKKILNDEATDDHTKATLIAPLFKSVKTSGGNVPAMVITHIEACSGSHAAPSIRVKPAHVLYGLLACAVIALVAWIIAANPFAGLIQPADTTVNPDSLVTTKAPHQADTTFVSAPVDSLALKAEQDSIKNAAALKAHVLDSLKAAKAKRDALKAKEKAAEPEPTDQSEIKEVHSEPAPAEPAPTTTEEPK